MNVYMKKRIMFLATVYEYGGISSVIKNILGNLDREIFDPVFLVEYLPPRHYPLREGIRFINMNVQPRKGSIQKLVNIFQHLYILRKTVNQEKPDIILGFGSVINCSLLLLSLSLIKPAPKIVLVECSEYLFIKQNTKNFKERVLRLVYKMLVFLLYHSSDAVICVSKSLERHVQRLFLMDAKKVNVINVPVDIKDIKARSQEKALEAIKGLRYVGTISRLSSEKGVRYLLEAFLDLLKQIDIGLIIVGEGDERQALEQMARDFRIEDKVKFLGWMENPYCYLRQMEVFVLASLCEGSPNVIIESMICGVPVVAFKSVGGIEELIEDEVNGLLAPAKDTKALSNCIYRLLQDKELKDRLIRCSAEKAAQFNSSDIVKKYESIMSNL